MHRSNQIQLIHLKKPFQQRLPGKRKHLLRIGKNSKKF